MKEYKLTYKFFELVEIIKAENEKEAIEEAKDRAKFRIVRSPEFSVSEIKTNIIERK